jgi:hypothetical protein
MEMRMFKNVCMGGLIVAAMGAMHLSHAADPAKIGFITTLSTPA